MWKNSFGYRGASQIWKEWKLSSRIDHIDDVLFGFFNPQASLNIEVIQKLTLDRMHKSIFTMDSSISDYDL